MTYEIVRRATGRGFALVVWDPRQNTFFVDAPGGWSYATRCEDEARRYAAWYGEPLRAADGKLITSRRDAAAEVAELKAAAELLPL